MPITRPAPAPAATITTSLLLSLALLSAVAPVATDLYLPAFPEMASELGASASAVQLTLMAFLLGITAGQLVFGPLSDRVGRFWPLLVGTVLCVVASVVAATAPDIAVLIAARFAQGFTGAAGMVIGRAIVSDLASGKAAARAFSLMMIVGGVAPVIAPFAGSLLVGPVGWRGILWVVCAVVVLMFIVTVAVIRESHPQERRHQLRTGNRAKRSLLSRTFTGNTLAFAFGFSVMMAYISASPFVYQSMIGMTPVQYGATFGVNALGISVMSAISARLAHRVPVRTLLGTGLGVTLAAAVTVLVLVLTGAPAWTLTAPIFVAVASQGLILGNATALALASVPHQAGTGSAVLGALQFGIGALVSPLVGLGGEHTALPLALVMCACSVVAVAGFALARPRSDSAQVSV
ncbi:Bcr/CflA family drug resistance efflux transporter [Mycobacterium sp. MS1601]|uniref:multidrug effflux MFS transporter n=1 Tax=Mycobacterium sp. MS1601 TaxID=1936029 RepID=UPI0009793B6B|nr:multidrug effflux MFS transporter [Mycobacterium sp. MS1601]AQA06391.1 Bcr/CflA family drug resistance efflux transporter [Mycobacterium sp. MS1601]